MSKIKLVIAAIHKVDQGKQYYTSNITATLLSSDSTVQKPMFHNSQLSNITSREIEILKLIANGFSNKEIGDRLFMGHRTVDTHCTNLMMKDYMLRA